MTFFVHKLDGTIVLETDDLQEAIRTADENAPAAVSTTSRATSIEADDDQERQ